MQAWFSKFVRGRAFSILFCIVGAGLTLYLTDRLGLLAGSFFSLDLRLPILLLLSAVCLYMLLYVNLRREEKRTRKLFTLCGIIFCFFPTTVLSFLLFDLIRGIFGLTDERLYLLPLLAGIGIAGYGFIHARKLCIQEYTLPIAGSGAAGTELTAALLSDLHVGSYVDRAQLGHIVDTVIQQHPDLVILAGDTFDQDAFGHCDMEGIRAELQRLQPRGQVYAVLGNHDPHSTHPEVRAFFESAGIHLLIDETLETEHFLIAGRDDILGNPSRRTLSDLLADTDSEKPRIVIDHNPLGIEEAIQERAAVILCGHTHKGQFFPATLFTRLAYGERGFYGHFQTGNTHSVVSSGAGYFQLPVRIGTNSEVVVLRLHLQ